MLKERVAILVLTAVRIAVAVLCSPAVALVVTYNPADKGTDGPSIGYAAIEVACTIPCVIAAVHSVMYRSRTVRGNVSCTSFRIEQANWSAVVQDALWLELISALGCDSDDDLQRVAVKQTQDRTVLVIVVGPGNLELVDSLAALVIGIASTAPWNYGLQ
eukprot:m51a1_g7841 hypothetical protein (160) ;mRNA; f:198288-203502